MRQKSFYRFSLSLCVGLVIFISLHFTGFDQIAKATEPSKNQTISPSLLGSENEVAQKHQEDKAVFYYNSGKYREAIQLWNESLKQVSDKKLRAILHTNLGSAYRQSGSLGQAIKQWEEAAKIYQSFSDADSRHLRSQVLTEQAQAYNALGQPRTALPILQSTISLAQKNQDQATQAAAKGVLGNTYLALGDFEKAITEGKSSLDAAKQLKNSILIATAWNNLGNVYQNRYQRYTLQASSAQREGDDTEKERLLQLATQDANAAQDAYSKSVEESKAIGGIQQAKALINLARFLVIQKSPQEELIAKYREQAYSILTNTPDSRAKAYSLINLAESMDKREVNQNQKIQTLEKAISISQSIADKRAESFALTAIGQAYEEEGNFSKAMELTQQAQFAAQQINAADSLYRSQAQAGRIYNALGKKELATVAYRQAITSLQTIRGDIVVANKDLQFDLRDSTEPVYREYMALLLEKTAEGKNYKSINSQSSIEEVLKVSELLQLSELQNFFGDECVQVARSTTNEQLANQNAIKNTAFIHSIVLDNKTYMLLQLPNGTFNSYPVTISQQDLNEQIEQLRSTLEDISTDKYLTSSQKVYDLLIRPMASDLASSHAKTLVFINDGVLRNIPMAALHNGKEFLVQQYAIANSLGTNLTPSRRSLKPENSKAVIFGLSVEIPPFAPLPYVKAETEGLQKILGGKRFLDKEFTLANLEKEIDKNSYPIVHLATHGKFGADSASTFLQLYDQRVALPEFESVLRRSKEPIELLALSACQTASGDSRATLGLAGVALRAGVKSTLATLWFVNDADTVPLIKNFYTEMQQKGITKAEALRQAQLKVIADANGHPAIWSPFVLVGNWQ
ncbi:MAG: CHAT domain-containing protein [Scytonematopsis contorta HA4267-MV1]|jgi:CHAT domain-containing protein|nr:CHAT domain-containing protein [Scytonematopsis contorta HA4267-MV1]